MTALDDRPAIRPATGDDPRIPWRQRAACNGVSVEIFFPHRSNSAEANRAAAFCRACRVFDECGADAEAGGCRTFGVWAGRYWEEGRARPITEPSGLANDERIEAARVRRREALGRWLQMRPRYHSDHAAHHALAAEYGVTGDTVKQWIKRARTEMAADYLDAKNAAEADAA